MSAATIDRSLRETRELAGGRKRRRTAPPSPVRRSIPVRTFSDWDDPPPGFAEADLVAHSGPVTRGSFVQTLVVTDIATGWTECAPVLYRDQTLLREVLGEVRRLMPFDLLGFDTDNDSVFINETLRDYCRDAGIVFTRCRPWRKNDQAFVEQKNGVVVRRIVGYRRLEGLEAAAALSRLYATTRLYVNFFQPSFKLLSKRRDGARVSKRYHPPATPGQRLLADPRTPAAVCERVAELSAPLDPIRLLRQMRAHQQRFRGHRRRTGCRTGGRGGGAARAVPLRLAHRVGGRGSEADRQPAREAEARASASGSAGQGDGNGCMAGSRPSRGAQAANCSNAGRRFHRRWSSVPARTPRRSASRAVCWRWRACCATRCRECPCGRACRRAPADRSRCRATLPVGELRKGHAQELARARKGLHVAVSAVAPNAFSKNANWQMVHHLGEHERA